MAQYRKKPIVVEATQWFPGIEIPGVNYGRVDTNAWFITIQGDRVSLAPGDWVITEADGINHYPCKADIFAATYDPV